MLLLSVFAVLLYISVCQTYKWSLFNNETLDVCNNQQCAERPHSSCLPQVPSDSCKKFKNLPMKKREIEFIIKGHNGLRNYISQRPGKPASNMNLLHWDFDLQRMAYGWVVHCAIRKDDCNIICMNIQ